MECPVKLPLFLVVLFFFATECVGLADMASAKQLYDSQKYQEALKEIEQNGFKNPEDFYNAGNCYFKLNKIGQAYAYYLKADASAHYSEDVSYNLKLARSRVQNSDKGSTSFLYDFLIPTAHRVSWNVYLGLFAILNLVLGFLFLQRVKTTALIALSLVGLALLSSGIFLFYLKQIDLAAVIADSATIRSGPMDSFSEVSHLQAGSQVEITGEARQGWKQIRFGLGNLGWIMEKDLLEL